jgi:hypothetical protein
MPVRVDTITMDCRDEQILSAFWTAAFGYEVAVDPPGDWMVLRDPSGTGPSIGLQFVPEPKVVKNRVHLDLIPTGMSSRPRSGDWSVSARGGCATSRTILTNRTGSWLTRKRTSSAASGRHRNPGHRGRRDNACR